MRITVQRNLERLLREECQIAEVILLQKSNFSAPAEAAIIESARGWDVVVTGLGD